MIGSDRVSLNIKISAKLNQELKNVRKDARELGRKFNVSALVEEFLTKEAMAVADELSTLRAKYRADLEKSDEQQIDAFPDELKEFSNDI